MLRLSRWLCYGNVFILFFALVQHVAPLCLQWLLAQLFHAAWPGSMGHSSVYLSLMTMYEKDYKNLAYKHALHLYPASCLPNDAISNACSKVHCFIKATSSGQSCLIASCIS